MSSMTRPNGSKINQLSHQLPEGLLVDAAWMERHGYSRALRSHYVSAGWLEQPAHRVYRRGHAPLRWEHVVISLQTLLGLPLILGGRTALHLHGFSHYLAPQLGEVHLYGAVALPTWVEKLPLEVAFRHHTRGRLFANNPITLGPGAGPTHDDHQIVWGASEWPLTLSRPERALLELLDELPNRESFHQVDMLMAGLASLSPQRLTRLLADCHSVKVKRLFFFFADRHHHPWRHHLRADTFDVGTGKRVLVKGGRLDPTYLITVPGDLDGVQ